MSSYFYTIPGNPDYTIPDIPIINCTIICIPELLFINYCSIFSYFYWSYSIFNIYEFNASSIGSNDKVNYIR